MDCDHTFFEPGHSKDSQSHFVLIHFLEGVDSKESCTKIVENRMVIRIKRVGGFVCECGGPYLLESPWSSTIKVLLFKDAI